MAGGQELHCSFWLWRTQERSLRAWDTSDTWWPLSDIPLLLFLPCSPLLPLLLPLCSAQSLIHLQSTCNSTAESCLLHLLASLVLCWISELQHVTAVQKSITAVPSEKMELCRKRLWRGQTTAFQQWYLVGIQWPFLCRFILVEKQLKHMLSYPRDTVAGNGLWYVGYGVPHLACRHRFPKITRPASLEKQTKQLIKMKLYRKRSQTECSYGSALGHRLCPSGLAFTERESDTVAGKRGDLGEWNSLQTSAGLPFDFFPFLLIIFNQGLSLNPLKQTFTNADETQ